MKISQMGFANALRGGRVVNQANSITGGGINIYEPRTMLPAFKKRMPVTTFLRDRYFPGARVFPTKHVDMDYYKGGQEVAPFVVDGAGPVNIKRDGFKTQSYTAPFINIGRPYDVNLLETRLPGEELYSGLTPEERAARLIQEDYQELDDRITRREELMVAQCLQTGTVTLTGYIDDSATVVRTDTLDFDFENDITLTGSDRWGQSGSNKYGVLEENVELVRKAGYNPTDIVLGANAKKLLLSDDNFISRYFDRRNVNFGLLNPQLQIDNGNGYAYLGNLTELGVDLWVYLAWYKDVDGTVKPYINDNRVLILPQNIGEIAYGAVTIIPEGSDDFVTVEGTRVPKMTVDRNKDTKQLSVKSRPVAKPFDVTAWVSIDVNSSTV
jgi:hypothetical protein